MTDLVTMYHIFLKTLDVIRTDAPMTLVKNTKLSTVCTTSTNKDSRSYSKSRKTPL